MIELVGRLVKELRTEARLELDDLAERAGLLVEELKAFEEEGRAVSTAALDRLAYALAVDPDALAEGRSVRRPNATLFFRQGSFPDFRDDQDRPTVAAALERALALVEINEILGRSSGLRAGFAPEAPGSEPDKDGYRLAWKVRAALGNEVEPLADVVELLEDRFGVLVLTAPLRTRSIHALTVKETTRGAAATILNAMSPRRKNPRADRVDLLHELGHILFDPANDEVNLVIDDEAGAAAGGERLTKIERRANAFAAEMLIPQRGLRKVLGDPSYEMSVQAALGLVHRAREVFATPIEITVNHLVNREYVWIEIRERLIEYARGSAEASESVEAVPAARRSVLEHRVLEALDRELITRMKARELLGLTAWDDLPSAPVGS